MFNPRISTSHSWYSPIEIPSCSAISSSPGVRCSRCSAAAIAASICFACRRFCRGAQSSPRRLSRIAPRILYSA